MSERCEVVEGEIYVCGEPAPYAIQHDGRFEQCCGHHAALAILADSVVIGPSGNPVRYDHIDGDLYEVAS